MVFVVYSCPYCSVAQDGNQFVDAVFNNTVNIVELEEGFDAETYAVLYLIHLNSLLSSRFFMYMFMVSGLCLFMFIVHYAWTTVKRVCDILMYTTILFFHFYSLVAR